MVAHEASWALVILATELEGLPKLQEDARRTHFTKEESEGHRKCWRGGACRQSLLHGWLLFKRSLSFSLHHWFSRIPFTPQQKAWAWDNVLQGGDLEQVTRSLSLEKPQVWEEVWYEHSLHFTPKRCIYFTSESD